MADNRIERERQKALSGVLDRVAPFAADGSTALLVTTTTVTTYPSTAASFYASNPTEIDGSEVEGGAASYTADTTQVVYRPQCRNAGPAGRHAGSWHTRSGDGGCFASMDDRIAANEPGEVFSPPSTFFAIRTLLSR